MCIRNINGNIVCSLIFRQSHLFNILITDNPKLKGSNLILDKYLNYFCVNRRSDLALLNELDDRDKKTR